MAWALPWNQVSQQHLSVEITCLSCINTLYDFHTCTNKFVIGIFAYEITHTCRENQTLHGTSKSWSLNNSQVVWVLSRTWVCHDTVIQYHPSPSNMWLWVEIIVYCVSTKQFNPGFNGYEKLIRCLAMRIGSIFNYMLPVIKYFSLFHLFILHILTSR